VLPIAVSGVISRTALQHRIARRFADPKEREWAAATLQVLCRRLRDTRTRVVIGEPISARQFTRQAIHSAMASLLTRMSCPHTEDLATGNQTRPIMSSPRGCGLAATGLTAISTSGPGSSSDNSG